MSQRRPHLVHAFAECRDCEWRNGDRHEAVRKASEHHRKTGHEVIVETGYAKTIERREK